MKIRTNFVTNSSSYSSAEIKIDNPVLLKILEKYREKGAFMSNEGYELGNSIGSSEYKNKAFIYENNPCYSEKEIRRELRRLDATPMALYFYESEQANVYFAPKSVEDIVNLILDVIADEDRQCDLANKELFEECKKELKARAAEINESYVEVSWEAQDDSLGDSAPEGNGETSWTFYYKK